MNLQNPIILKNTTKIESILFTISFLKLIGFGNGSLKKILYKILKKFIGDNQIFYNYHGRKFLLNPLTNSTDSKIIISSRYLEKTELNYLKITVKNKNSIFLDIGANTGYYSIMAAGFGFKKIYAFEPIKETIDKLKQNISINKLSEKIEIIDKAIGDKNLQKTIYKDLDNIGNSSLIIKNRNFKENRIQMTTLVDFIKEKKIDKIHSIKIDVEGYEDRALIPFLNSLKFKNFPKLIILEHSNKKIWNSDLIGLLKSKGYKLVNSSRGNSIFEF